MYDLIPSAKCSQINKFVISEREKKLKVLSEDKDIFRGHCRGERQIQDDYAGREILELVQNADDASNPNGKIKIVLDGNYLYFYNDGKPFDEEGILSLLVPNNSFKGDKLIGQKGLGFRALLNESNFIRIESGELSIRFGREDNLEYFNHHNQYNFPERPPILNTPRVVEPIGTDGFTTMVYLELKNEDAVKRMQGMIDEISARTLLFLQNDTEILVEMNGEKRHYTKEESRGKCYTHTFIDGVETESHTYEIAKKSYTMNVENSDGVLEPKKAQVVMAYDTAQTITAGKSYRTLYSYLPTKIQFPTNWHIHATFDLTANRSDIIENPYNWRLLKEIIDLMFSHAEKRIAAEPFGTTWRGCDYIIGNYDKFDDDLRYDGQTIEEYFMEKLKTAKILPTTNGEYISFADGPKHYANDLAHYLKGPDFAQLLEYAEDAIYDDLVEAHGATGYDLAYLRDKINARLPHMTLQNRVELAEKYHLEFDGRGLDQSLIPDFFLGQNSQAIPAKHVKFIEPSSQEVFENLPDFVEFGFLQQEMYEAIRAELGVSAREFPTTDFAHFYDIRQYRLNTVTGQYYNSLKRRKTQPTAPREWAAFLVWMYRNDILGNQDAKSEIAEAMVPNSRNQLVPANKAFFSGDYGYDLCEQLWPDSDYIIADYSFFGLAAIDKLSFTEFLTNLGVAKHPRINQDGSMDQLDSILEQASLAAIQKLLLDPSIDLWASAAARTTINLTKWVPIDGEKYAPAQIILQKSLSHHFDKIIGLSSENLSSIIGEEMFARLKEHLGVSASITRFQKVETIYRILLGLPDKDPSGDTMRRFQRELAEMRDADIDEMLASAGEYYHRFLEEGKVFCLDKKYHPASETFYVANSCLPEAMTAGHNLIYVSRKQGALKIQKLFGVAKLNVDYEIHSFESSIYNEKLRPVLEDIKVGLVSNNEIVAADETVRKIKSLKIILANSVEINIDGETRALDEYDIAMDKTQLGKNYLVIPADTDWNRIRYRPKFIESMANIIIQEIGTETAEGKRGDIKALISSHDIYEEITLDEDGEEKWLLAKSKLYDSTERDEEDIIRDNYNAVKEATNLLEEQYRKSLYAYLLGQNVEEQMQYTPIAKAFLEWLPEWDDPKLAVRDFDAKAYVLSEQFANLDSNASNDCGEQNFQKIFSGLSETEQQIVSSDFRLRDLARFNREKELRAKISARLAEFKDHTEDEEAQNEKEVSLSKNREIKSTDLKPKARRKGHGGGGSWGGVVMSNTESDSRKKQNGKKGVKLVKEYLEKQGYKVIDRTGDAVADGESVNGDDSVGYDLEYTAHDTKYLIEVKTCSSPTNIHFFVSANEYRKAESVRNLKSIKYQVICVAGINSATPKHVVFDWPDLEPDLAPDNYHYNKVERTAN